MKIRATGLESLFDGHDVVVLLTREEAVLLIESLGYSPFYDISEPLIDGLDQLLLELDGK